MKKTYALALLLLISGLFTSGLFAQDFDQRMRDAYEANDQRADLGCYYYAPQTFKLVAPIGETLIERGSSGKMSRKFELISERGKTSFELSVFLDSRGDALYQAVFANGEAVGKKIKRVKDREFYLPFTSDRQFNNDFEIFRVYCAVNFAKEAPVELRGPKVHLNVHPHTRYDYFDFTTAKALAWMADDSYDSYTLLEEGNYKGNLVELEAFLRGSDYTLPKNFYDSNLNPPMSVELVVSPAGHNRFSLPTGEDLEVVYTGGNHNYCVWNNTRNLLYAYLRSPHENNLKIVYDTEALVVQRKGIIDGLSFSWFAHKKSNLLADLFKDEKAARKYHENYLEYFEDDFIEPFLGLFSTFTIEYKAESFRATKVIQGRGTRTLKLVMEYK